MARVPVTTTFYLNFATGQGFKVAQVGTGKSYTLVVHPVKKDDAGTWTVLHHPALRDSPLGGIDHQHILRANVRLWQEDQEVWTTAIVSPDEAWTLRTVMPADGIPAAVPYTIEKEN